MTTLSRFRIDILTLFPAMFAGPFGESIVKRAVDKGLVEINIHNLRDWTKDKHKTVDDRPYGGGVGMILKPESIFKAVEELKALTPRLPERQRRTPSKAEGDSSVAELPQNDEMKVVLLSPQGQSFSQRKAKEFSKLKHLILICGHYEGVDERVRKHLVDEETSIGDYVLTGGEIPAMVLVDATVRLIPGVLEKPEALTHESFQPPTSNHTSHHPPHTSHLLEFPQYTRPENFRGYKVPKILLSGNHKKIAQWRQKQSLLKTRQIRPGLLK